MQNNFPLARAFRIQRSTRSASTFAYDRLSHHPTRDLSQLVGCGELTTPSFRVCVLCVCVQAVGDWTTKVYNKLNFELSALQRFEDQSIPHDFLPVHVDGPYV